MKKQPTFKLNHDLSLILTAIVAVAVLVIIFNFTSLKNYLRGASFARVLNETFEEQVVLITNLNGRDDTLLDLADLGFVYSSQTDSPLNANQLRYQRIDSGEFIGVDGYGFNAADKFAAAKTDDTYVVWGDNGADPDNNMTSIYYRQIIPLGNKFFIPQNPGDRDNEADIYNGTIAFIRQGNGNYGSIWTYIPVSHALTEWPTINSSKQNIRFNDNKIVWADKRTGNWDIWMIDLGSGNPQEQPVIVAPHNQTQPDISNNRVVWTDDEDVNNPNMDDYNVWMKDISSLDNEPQKITTNNRSQTYPAIYNNIIVWQDNRNDDGSFGFVGNNDIYMYDLDAISTPEKFVVSDGTNGKAGSRQTPLINNGYIFWTWLLSPEADPGMDRSIAYTTYDELNLISPGSGINFNFADIKFSWEFKQAGVPVNNATYTLKAENLDSGDIKTVNLGGNTNFTLLNNIAETLMKDGVWEWSVKATALGLPEYWSTVRIVIKKTAADLLVPLDNAEVTLGTKFDWSDIPNANLYIAKIGGYLPEGKFLYLPLPGNISEFVITQNIYDLLKPLSGEKTYTWTVSGTKLPTPTDWQTIWYGPALTFKVKA
ncbi:TPA: hypothetical protein DCR79_00515 [Patescibacteria group bacterium]|nr:hypothetical protein [Patescibacteria group bacterium]